MKKMDCTIRIAKTKTEKINLNPIFIQQNWGIPSFSSSEPKAHKVSL